MYIKINTAETHNSLFAMTRQGTAGLVCQKQPSKDHETLEAMSADSKESG